MRLRSILILAASFALVGCAETRSPAVVEEEGDEVKVNIADVPAPVRETLSRESNNAKIDTVDKETTRDGKTIYEADAMVNGQNWEIKVDPDGKLITKKPDNEEDEKSEAREKHEKNQKEKDND